MDQTTMQTLIEMGVSLTGLAVKGTASAISKRIRAAKDIKDAEKLRIIYDELINELLQEREEAVQLAQAYKSELERIVICDEDIEHLHNTVSRILDIVKAFQLASASDKGEVELERVEKQITSYEQIKELISVDTLKTMQLLGFNFKAAIGDPLTQICADTILNLSNNKNKTSQGRTQNKR